MREKARKLLLLLLMPKLRSITSSVPNDEEEAKKEMRAEAGPRGSDSHLQRCFFVQSIPPLSSKHMQSTALTTQTANESHNDYRIETEHLPGLSFLLVKCFYESFKFLLDLTNFLCKEEKKEQDVKNFPQNI